MGKELQTVCTCTQLAKIAAVPTIAVSAGKLFPRMRIMMAPHVASLCDRKTREHMMQGRRKWESGERGWRGGYAIPHRITTNAPLKLAPQPGWEQMYGRSPLWQLTDVGRRFGPEFEKELGKGGGGVRIFVKQVYET
jgi:hypothetical protein